MFFKGEAVSKHGTSSAFNMMGYTYNILVLFVNSIISGM